jgi:hypothetical protein
MVSLRPPGLSSLRTSSNLQILQWGRSSFQFVPLFAEMVDVAGIETYSDPISLRMAAGPSGRAAVIAG